MTTTRPLSIAAKVAIVAPGVVVALTLATVALVLGPVLPVRIAIHFRADGSPDGWSSPWLVLGISLVVAALAAILAIVSLASRDRRTAAMRLLVANLIAGTLATAWIALVLTDAVGDGSLPAWWGAVFLAVGAAAAAIPAIALIRGTAPVPAHEPSPLAIPATARVAWRAHTGSRWFTGIGALLLTLGIALVGWPAALGGGDGVVSGVVLVVVGVATLALARVQVTVDIRGLRVTSSWTRIPIMRLPLDRIESCGWEEASPGQWGGWGYRISGRGIAYVTGSGPGLVARLANGQARMVSVEDAERGAAALGSLLAARRVPTGGAQR